MTMFPSLYRGDDKDRNRRVARWQPGDPTPRSVVWGTVIFLVVAILMIFNGVLLLTASWNRDPINEAEAETMRFVQNNARILGGINVVLGLLIGYLTRGVRQGYRTRRRWILWLSALAMFFMLAGWVAQFTGPGQALLAFGLAVAALMVFRPQADPYFDAGHRLEEEPAEPTIPPEPDGRQ